MQESNAKFIFMVMWTGKIDSHNISAMIDSFMYWEKQ